MITPKEIIEFIDQRLKGPVVPLDVERDAISMIEEYAVEQHQILATQPQPTMSAEEQMIDFSWWLVKNLGKFSDDMQAHFNGEYLNIWRKSESLEYRNQPIEFTPPRTEQEEADRLVELFADIDFEDSVLRSIQVVSYHRDNLKLRGLSTTFEEKVLTILKGM